MKSFLFLFSTLNILFCTLSSAQNGTGSSDLEMDPTLYGVWSNESHFLVIRNDDEIFFDINKSCGFITPINIINDTTFEVVWDYSLDCIYQIGLEKDFNLTKVPETGKAFAKYTLVDKNIIVEYYYPEWVEAYTDNELWGLFSENYFKIDD